MSQVLEANGRGASRDQERDNSFGDRMPLESQREKMGQKRNIYERKTKQSFTCLHRVLSNGVTELGVVNVEILIVIFKLRCSSI